MLVTLQAAHRGYPRKGRYGLRPVRSSAQLALGTLAANVAVTGSVFADPVGRPYRLISMIASWTLEDFNDDEGPVICGYAHGDYTATEIKECIEAGGSINVGNKVEAERANRLVRIVGTFGGSGVQNAVVDLVINDGKPIKTRLNWLIPIGQTFNMFAYNDSSVANLTTGTLLKINGTAYVKDL